MTKCLPESHKDRIRQTWQSGLNFLNWWDKPINCSCGENRSEPSSFNAGIVVLQNIAQLILANIASPGQKYGDLSMYERLGGDWFRTLADTTIPISSKGVVGNPNSIKRWVNPNWAMEVRGVRTEAVGGFKGLPGSVLLGGLIDSGAQVATDLLSMKCLSPEQIALRGIIALEFGLLAASIGTAATAGGIVLGASASVAATTGFIASFVTAHLLAPTRDLYLDFIEVAY